MATYGVHARVEIDVEELRSYLLELCGTAMAAGLGLALMHVVEVENASGEELVKIALQLGVDPARFEVRQY